MADDEDYEAQYRQRLEQRERERQNSWQHRLKNWVSDPETGPYDSSVRALGRAKDYWFGEDEDMGSALEEINVIPQKRLPERIPGGPRDPQGTPRGGPALSLPASPSAQGGATPASTGAGGGAGNPMQMFESAEPESVISSAETAAKTTAKTGATADPQADAQKKQINEAMAAQGMDPKQAYEELRDQFMNRLETQHSRGEITKKQHTKLKDRWKNIFNVVPEEDFGLFLMDFGLRLAAHSADNSFGGAFGQAGLGALGGVQERKRYGQEMALKRDEAAHGRAMDVTKLGIDERRNRALEKYYEGIGAGQRAQQTIDTDQGLIQYNPETKVWEPVTVDGKRVSKSYASSGGYQGEKHWFKGQMEDTGMSDSEINAILAGAKTPQERAQMLQDKLTEYMGDITKSYRDSDGNRKKYADLTPEEQQAWLVRMMNVADAAANEYQGQRRGALPE